MGSPFNPLDTLGFQDQQQQQQQPQAQPMAQPAAQPQAVPNPIQAQIQRESQALQDQQPTSNRGGPIKRLLFNFLAGAGAAMQKDVGLPTQQEQQQRHISNIVQLSNAQSLESQRQADEQYRQMLTQGMQRTPSFGLAPFGIPDGTPATDRERLQAMMSYAAGQQKTQQQLAVGQQAGQFGLQKEQIAAQTKTPTEIALRVRADQGDKDAQRILDKIQSDKISQAAARGQAFGAYRPVGVVDDEGNLKYEYAGQAIKEGSAPAAQGMQTMSKQAQFSEMKNASVRFRDSISQLDRDFTPDQIAKLTLASKSPDEGVLSTVTNSLLGDQRLTPAQQDYVIWHNQMMERILSLRNVAGMGQGAQDLRGAIQATIPGAQAGSKQYALKKMDAVDNQIDLLSRGIPKMPAGGASDLGAAMQSNGQPYPEGHTGHTSKGTPTVVRNGRWVKQ